MILSAANVTKRFEQEVAVSYVDISLEAGTIQGLLGSNGAGKTTLLKLLAGIYTEDSGTITYDGQPVYENSLIKDRVIFMPDHPYFFTASNLYEMGAFYRQSYSQFSIERFAQLIKMLKLNPKQRFNRMSKGMKRQALFVLALSSNPEVMLMDEPFDGLDPVVKHIIKNLLIQDVTDRNMSLLVSSHNLREMEDFCDSIAIMHEGEMLLNKQLDDLKKEHFKIQAAFEKLPPESFYKELDVVDRQIRGRVVTCIVKGRNQHIEQQITKYHPLMYDMLPLTLEEIFTYEMGGHGYAIENIIVE